MKLWHFGTMIILLFAFQGCTPADRLPTTELIQADCFWSATATAWLDENGNGVKDESEAPLEGIEFVLEPSAYSRTKTNSDGVAQILATTPVDGSEVSCDDLLAEMNPSVFPTQYDGYQLTTNDQVPYTGSDADYEFGFQLITTAEDPNQENLGQMENKASEPVPDDPIIIETEQFQGVIFSAGSAQAQDFASWFGVSIDGYWTPAESDIIQLEKNLPLFLEANNHVGTPYGDDPPLWDRLPEYGRQYLGIEMDGKRLIFANYFCDTFGSNWQETPIIVLDGGDCFFEIKYDVENQSFMSIYINGEA